MSRENIKHMDLNRNISSWTLSGGIHCWIPMCGQMPRIIALIYFIHYIHTLFLSKFSNCGRFVTASNIELSVKLLEIPCKMLLKKPCFLLNEMLSWKTVSGVCESHSKEQTYAIWARSVVGQKTVLLAPFLFEVSESCKIFIIFEIYKILKLF